MKILIVCSGNPPENEEFNFSLHQAFIYEQIEKIKEKYKVDYETFFIIQKGFIGYSKSIIKLRKFLKGKDFDIIHAHYGLCGLVAGLQFKLPVIVTYHGTDLRGRKAFIYSWISMIFSDYKIFVSKQLVKLAKASHNYSIIPCGVDFNNFYPIDKKEARFKMGLDTCKNYILFSSSFSNSVKNYALAALSFEKIQNCQLLELKGFDRYKVNLLLNAADAALLTSFSEGSPQFIKEAMATNCPIVATDVGDIKEIIGNTRNCYIVDFDASEIAEKISLIIQNPERTNGRERLQKFDNNIIAEKVFNIYNGIVTKNAK